jgi:hypothetical protein
MASVINYYEGIDLVALSAIIYPAYPNENQRQRLIPTHLRRLDFENLDKFPNDLFAIECF